MSLIVTSYDLNYGGGARTVALAFSSEKQKTKKDTHAKAQRRSACGSLFLCAFAPLREKFLNTLPPSLGHL
jgi:hypothetical protein